ncbi:S41 family peptidase [bacterium]|nr:S41 family peptidase [bacterium]
MSFHRMGSLLGAYSLVGLGLTSTIFLSQRYLPYPPEAVSSPTVQVTPPIVETPTPKEPTDPLENVDVVLDLLHQEYLSPINDRALFASSFRLLREFLKSQKMDVKDFPELPPKIDDRAQLTQAWKAMIVKMEPKVAPKFDHQKLVYLALKGMLGALKDPYCSVLEPREFRVFEEHMTGGNFSGIGVMIELDRDHKNRVTVSMPIDGGPASKAGIQAGDVLSKIDGQATEGWDIEKAANKIRGPQGTMVALSILRPKEKRQLELSVKRDMIHVRSCQSKMVKPKVGYLNVQVFAEETGKEFEEEVAKLKEKGAESLVIDLRNNGGGYINAALEICSHFVPRGQRVVSVVNKRLNQSSNHDSLGSAMIDWPCVVLVNRFSASASEITAGCMQDHKRAKLIGETTFGKASVQQLERLTDGGAFKYTVAHYLTPSGKDIHLKGIKVDVPVKVSEKDKEDVVLQRGVKMLQEQLSI